MITLVVRRTIRASPERLFDAWTQPAHLLKWWGPAGVECLDAQVDARVGGRYRIANRLPDGRVLWIAGEFERVEPPSLLVYTWRVEPQETAERVTVRFESRDNATDVVVVHERIADAATRDMHDRGWRECLEGLEAFMSAPTPR
ncbi:MAG TPA: SRPBCC domain-containing protein [Vicinamibacterales bacterium]|nr:SRPBCC domain-containing protein [Vicinamibacterales bacterium]